AYEVKRTHHAHFITIMLLKIKIVEPAVQPAETVRRGISIFGIVALRRCQAPGMEIFRFGKSRGEGHARFFDRLIDFEHHHELIARLAHYRVETTVADTRD